MSTLIESGTVKRLGHIFNSDGRYPWMYSHAANPTPIALSENVIRIFFSCRDANNRSHVAYVDYDMSNRCIKHVSESPILAPGKEGYFDDSGTSPGCVVLTQDGEYFLYYMGWNLMVTVPFLNTIGVAKGVSLDSFEKVKKVAILDRNPADPICLSYPWVIQEADRWRMWYGSTDSWKTDKYEMLHFFSHAESSDGIEWRPTGHIELPRLNDEYAFTRPCVIQEDGIYKMWFTVRGSEYVIGYAESHDGLNWQRGTTLLSGSGSGWDSQSVSYATVFSHKGERYILYAGDRYGKTGFGLAQIV